jgi:hypothetical protein
MPLRWQTNQDSDRHGALTRNRRAGRATPPACRPSGHSGDERSLIAALSIGWAGLPTLERGRRSVLGGQIDATRIAGADRACHSWSGDGRRGSCRRGLGGDESEPYPAGGRYDGDERSGRALGRPAERGDGSRAHARSRGAQRPTGFACSSAPGTAGSEGCRRDGAHRTAGSRGDGDADSGASGLAVRSARRAAAHHAADDPRQHRCERRDVRTKLGGRISRRRPGGWRRWRYW